MVVEEALQESSAGAPGEPNSETRIKTHGVLKLTLSSDRYQWDFLTVGGAGDSGSAACH